MTPDQRSAALRLADALNEGLSTSNGIATWASAAALLRELVAEPAQEPVGEVVEDDFSRQLVGIGNWHKLPNGTKLYSSPPQRKPLTEEQIDALPEFDRWWPHAMRYKLHSVARAVEAAHGITAAPSPTATTPADASPRR